MFKTNDILILIRNYQIREKEKMKNLKLDVST